MMRVVRMPLDGAMLLYQSIMLAIAQIWANKVRGILTTIGIMIGVAAVSAVIALIVGMRTKILSEFANMGTNRVDARPSLPGGWKGYRASFQSWVQAQFRMRDFEGLLAHCPSVAKFSRTRHVWARGVLSYGPKYISGWGLNVIGVDATWHEIENRRASLGREISVMDVAQVRPVCLVTPAIRDKLALDKDPTGQIIDWSGLRLLVIGVLEPPISAMGSNPDATEVLIPFTLASRVESTWGAQINAQAATPQATTDARDEIEFFLRQKKRLKVGQENNFRVISYERSLDEFNEISAMVTLIALSIVGISLLVGGVGIMNIMLVSVSERTREIGLRKAVGARPRAVLLQFLVEAVVLCLVGGAMGLILAQGLTAWVSSYLPESLRAARFVIPMEAVAVAFGFSAGVGLIFGMFPAIKAARLDPIEALRHE